jgi:putative ABC transport system ATP-binding protein
VLADEPTANLDSVTGQNILDLMRELNQTEHTTFIFSTHDARVMAHASKVVRIADGRVADIAEPGDVAHSQPPRAAGAASPHGGA